MTRPVETAQLICHTCGGRVEVDRAKLTDDVSGFLADHEPCGGFHYTAVLELAHR